MKYDIQILHDLSVAISRVMTDDSPPIYRHVSYIDQEDSVQVPEGKCYEITIHCELIDNSERKV